MFFTTGTTGRPPLGTNFHRLWGAVTVSSLGDGMRFVALPLLATRLTSDPRQIAAVAMAEQLPLLLLGLLAGALADRLDRRRTLWLVDTVRALAAALLAAAVAAQAVTIPLLLTAGFLLGCGQTLYNGSWSGMIPSTVAPAALPRANARLQAGALITDTLIGTPLGAVLFGLAAALPFAVDSASFAIAALLALLLRGDFRARRHRPERAPSLRADTAAGLRWLWRHPVLRRLCLSSGLSNLVGGGLTAILVIYAHQVLALGDLGFSLLVASFALGGVCGALLAPRLADRYATPVLLRGTLLLTAVLALALGAANSGAVAAGCVALYGAASVAWGVTAVSLRQRLVPAELTGRVGMVYQMVIGAGMTLGTVAAGLLAHAYGVRVPFFAGAVLLACTALVRLRVPVAATVSA